MNKNNPFKTCLFMALVVLWPLVGHSQFTSHRVGLNLAPALTKQYNPDLAASSPFYVERAMFVGGSIGFSVLHDIGSRLQLQTDLLFSIYTDRATRESNLVTHHPELGFILGGDPQTLVLINEYQTLSLPILVNYYLNNERSKWRMFVSGGVRAHLFIASYHSTFIKEDPVETFEENRVQVGILGDSRYRSITMSAQMGLGIEYQKSPTFSFRMAPYFEHSVFNTLRNNPNQERIYAMAAGVSLGLYWR
jgi:hypothetical protein